METFRRNVPDFAISYVIVGSRKAEVPQEADYNELSVVSEEFFDRMFVSVFEDLAVGHFGTAVYALINEDTPFLVSFRVTLDFAIPGEVPTVQFLIDRVREAFERESSRTTYLFDLNTMSETNPFSATTSFSLIAGSENSSDGVVGGPGSNKPPDVSSDDGVMTKKHVMITFLSGIGFLIVVSAGFLWVRGNKKPEFRPQRHSESTSTLSFYNGKLGIDSRGDETERSAESTEYGADDETVQYLNSLRERYKDEIIESKQETQRPVGFRDFVEDDSEIKEEKDGIVFLQFDDQQAAESAYGGCPSMQPTQDNERPSMSIRDILNLELNGTDAGFEDDLGSIMN